MLIVGSTGSIGSQALDIVRQYPEVVRPAGLSANCNWETLAAQINEFKPEVAYLADEETRPNLKEALSHKKTRLLESKDEFYDAISTLNYDILLNALVGFAGFIPTVKALKAGKKVALANKESLVVGGELLRSYCDELDRRLIPVDSEHSAILQCLVGEPEKSIEKLIITASGGPFRELDPAHLKDVKVEDALDHPNWDMGAKITIDSATMMNKGLEVIEAHYLFNQPMENIEAVIHPQSIIHSMVTFTDGSTKAQLGLPDMKLPILYAITYPERWYFETPRMDWSVQQQLTFHPVDHKRFPCFRLALEAITEGNHAPAVMNAANELAVKRFLNKEIRYDHIARIVEEALQTFQNHRQLSVESLYNTDSETRKFAQNLSLNQV